MEKVWPERSDWQRGPRFGALYSFMGVPATRDVGHADVVIVGLPFDGASEIRSGARYGPRAIRSASGMLLSYSDDSSVRGLPFAKLRAVDYGDLYLIPYDVEETLGRTQRALQDILNADVVLICLGGDHSLSLATTRAHARKHGPLSMVLLDAHPDFWTSPRPLPSYHSNWLRIAVEEGVVDPKRSIVVGFRGSNSLAILDKVQAAGITVITTEDVGRQGSGWALQEIRRVATGPTYVSLDMDCVDPAFAPAVGVPEAGGFTSREVMALVRGLRGLPVVGFDVMEVNPSYDHGEITALLAATLVYEFLMSRT